MPVHVEGGLDIPVAEMLLNRLGVSVGGDQQRRAGVAQIEGLEKGLRST